MAYKTNKLLYGAEYYDEYIPYDRLEEDIRMMKAAGLNVTRIGESTWSTYEPQEGVFDFSHVIRALDAFEKAGISVFIGTPTYAVPTWMAKSYPDVLAVTKKGPGMYGPRQIVDITNPTYLFYCERIIRKLMEITAHRKCVIGFQVDNETCHYGTAGRHVQELFVKYLRRKFDNDLEALNFEFGLDYWSNRINAWEDFPDVRNTINGSLGAEFEKFQRTLVDDFLRWQVKIVEEYAREDQFISQDFYCGWTDNNNVGVQKNTDVYHAARPLSIASINVYHPSQDDLTGMDIAYCGDTGRSLKDGANYFITETQAQGFPCWTPYKGQLRLCAFANVASGANMVQYWHWSSIHNACETYWKGLLGHDFKENDVYRESKKVGKEFAEIGSHLVNLKKQNKVALLLSNEALTALEWFPIDMGLTFGKVQGKIGYNDIVKYIYEQLYKMNIECDIIWPETENFQKYSLLIVPALYAASDELLQRINEYVEKGGHLFTTFKTAYANENVKVYWDHFPHRLHECLGVTYTQVSVPQKVKLASSVFSAEDTWIDTFMEVLEPTTAETLATYDHYNWDGIPAITKNRYGKGTAFYMGCKVSDSYLREILQYVMMEAGLWGSEHKIPFPIIIKKGYNELGKEIVYYFNFSADCHTITYCGDTGTELFSGESVKNGDEISLERWDLKIIER